MSTGERIAARYRGWTTKQLRSAPKLIRNPRSLAAVKIVLSERTTANQRGYDAGQMLLDALGGLGIQELHDDLIEGVQRLAAESKFVEAEQAQGMADALWEWITDRSDM